MIGQQTSWPARVRAALRGAVREPLLHFLAIGAVLFAIGQLAGSSDADRRVVVSQARQVALAQNFARTWQRQPTRPELDGLIDEHVRDEILTHEAMRLGLDRDDTVIRRRLRQKLEIITEEAAASNLPTDAQLDAYRQAHREQFRSEARYAFEQVYFDAVRRGAHLDSDVAGAKRTLESEPALGGAAAGARVAGDALFVLQPAYALTSEHDLANSFGADFVTALAALPADATGHWVGPIPSGYGQHLVRLLQVVPGNDRPLAEMRDLVEREWRNAQRVAAREAQYRALRDRYQVVVAGRAAP